MKIDNSIKITLIIVLGFIVLGLLGYAGFNKFIESVNPSETIKVTGQAEIKTIPDLVSIYFRVETKRINSSQAKDANSEIVEKVIKDIIDLGFERKDITTENFNIYENCEWKNTGKIYSGYKATHTIKVEIKIQELEKIGKVIDTGVNAGANVNYLNFELSQEKQNQYKAEAMKLASQDAKIKADSVAQGLNQKIGKLVSVSVNEFNYYPWRFYDAIAESTTDTIKESVTNIQPGEEKISASVTAIFRIN